MTRSALSCAKHIFSHPPSVGGRLALDSLPPTSQFSVHAPVEYCNTVEVEVRQLGQLPDLSGDTACPTHFSSSQGRRGSTAGRGALLHSQARTAVAGSTTHLLPATWGHTYKQRLHVDKRQTQVAKRPALNLPSSRDYCRGWQCAGDAPR
jgi:hypothetical protein